MGYRPQLDGIRCLAVFAVLFHHFWNPTTYAGAIGVRLFFVLSGFLISGILIEAKADMQAQGLRETLRVFYVRRALRIFPPFYLVLLIGFLAAVPEVRDPIWWHVTYTTNFHFVLQGYYDDWTAHLWSLAVEEQFYLVWPLAVLLLRRRWLVGATIAMILSAPLLRAIVLSVPLNGLSGYILPLAAADSLGCGALLALARETTWRSVLTRAGVVCFAALAIISLAGVERYARWFYYIAFDTLMSLAFTWVIFSAYSGFRGAVGRFLEFAPVRYLGKISYGIYLYHGFAALLVARLAIPLNVPAQPGARQFVMLSAVTVVAALLSWHVYERLWLRLKESFAYRRPAALATKVGHGLLAKLRKGPMVP